MNRNELNRNRTIEDIKSSFIDIYEKKGIDGVSVREICDGAGVSRTIFYKYFDDKYQVLEEIEEELLRATNELNRNLKDTPIWEYEKGKGYRVLVETIEYIGSQKKYFKPLLSQKGDPSFIFRWKKQIRGDVRGRISGNVFAGVDADVINELFAAICIGLYTYWFFENPDLTAAQMAEFESYVIHMLFVSVAGDDK